VRDDVVTSVCTRRHDDVTPTASGQSTGYTVDQSASGCMEKPRKPMPGLTIQYGWHICNENIVPRISCVEGVSSEDVGVVSA
jgi:hypothetical protein